MSKTLFLYISRRILVWFFGFLAVAAMVVLLLEVLELVRRAASRADVGLGTIVQMALLHLPHIIDIALPFAMLFAALAALSQLSRHHELAVARAAGLSIWQLLLPGLAVAFLIGVLKVVAFNPLVAVSLTMFEDFEAVYFDKKSSNTVFQESGLWLKDYSERYNFIVHANKLVPGSRYLEEVTVFEMSDDGKFEKRIDAARGVLKNGVWAFDDVSTVGPAQAAVQQPHLELPTRLTWLKLEDSFASPASMPVWRLPAFIRLLEDAGFSAAAHRVQLHIALAAPMAMVSMVLIAAGFAIRPPRRGGVLLLMTMAAIAGLGFHLLTQVFFRLGLSGQLPAALSAWAPVAFVTMLGAAWLLYTEDG
ncbi:MAG: LPS export ABC transporter permease LptG [Alphaproteobacteria bacterium]|nr:LPS export ABC transporter permease LptG [Alphaproteobacteria bacterium]MCB9928636.1 LPS export ABC transporter permease LptG [Alphaproteobacteria bacterium]